ncbi:hypothetical protein [Arthrobacter subterraneus]|uniref:hypothetical protein n=1 Tax=Arthrobacter subterraneus TaxID=335973 RepID=UPI0037F28DDB
MAAATFVFLLAGCASGEDVPQEQPSSSTAPPSVEASESATDIVQVEGANSLEIGNWRQSAKTVQGGASVYTDNVDGAVLAFEDFFSTAVEEVEPRVDDAIQSGVDRTHIPNAHAYIDVEALGSEKHQHLLEKNAEAITGMAIEDLGLKVARDGIQQDDDGSVTISDQNVYLDLDGVYLQNDPFGQELYKLKRNADGVWQIVDFTSTGEFGS